MGNVLSDLYSVTLARDRVGHGQLIQQCKTDVPLTTTALTSEIRLQNPFGGQLCQQCKVNVPLTTTALTLGGRLQIWPGGQLIQQCSISNMPAYLFPLFYFSQLIQAFLHLSALKFFSTFFVAFI